MKQKFRYLFAYIFALLYGFPYRKMSVVGVTGTDGKTTTCHIVYHLLKSQGKKVGLLSTIESVYFDGEREREMLSYWSKIDMPLRRMVLLPFTKAFNQGQHVTTAWAPTIQHMLYQLHKHGCEYVVLESTSHAFDQERLGCINYSVVGITNINYEHLDYHKTFERYLKAKATIFRIDSQIPQSDKMLRKAYINADDSMSQGFRRYAKDWNLTTFSLDGQGDINLSAVSYGLEYTRFTYQDVPFRTSLVGDYNVYNFALGLSLLQALGFDPELFVAAVAEFRSPKGRFERFATKKHGMVVVDFAHTPQSYEKLFGYLSRVEKKGKLINVFGCAGLRDSSKRAKMGALSGKHCTLSIVTAEDPRTERLEDINRQIIEGITSSGAVVWDGQRKILHGEHYYCVVEDRKKAIEQAIGLSEPGDIVLILGKGHEESLCFGETEVPWSDQQVAADYISQID